MHIRELHPNLQKKAIEEINEKPDRIESDLQIFKTWISKQPHLNARTDDQWLLTFLRGCKFSMEKAKEKIDHFYSVKHFAPEMTQNLNPYDPNVELMLNKGLIIPLGNIDGETSPRAHIIRPSCMDFKKMNIIENCKLTYMYLLLELRLHDDLPINGSHSIIDLEGVTLENMINMTPMNSKKIAAAGQDGTPARIKCIHYINAPAAAEKVIKLFQSFIKKKNSEKFAVYSKENLSKLYDHIPRKALPKEYGGESGTIATKIADLKKTLYENKDFLISEDNYITDEKKRIGPPKYANEMFGLDGTFRKLNFD